MRLDVVLLPRDLELGHLNHRAVAVFDVLRATTTMAAALDAGVSEIRVFGDTASALSAGRAFIGPRILCGEEKCLAPAGFDLGNSPVAFSRLLHAGRTAFMCTTNGTRAILAARGAPAVFIAAIVNASAAARALVSAKRDITLLCAGTGGVAAMEDLLGAGAVIDAMREIADLTLDSDIALMAQTLFAAQRENLRSTLRATRGGRNVINAGLEGDIDFAARLNALDVVGKVVGDPPVVRASPPMA